MTTMEFFGCLFVAYGPAFWMFVLTVFDHPIRMIVLTASSSIWIIGSIFISTLWIILPVKNNRLISITIAVLCQETIRILTHNMFVNLRGFKKAVGKETLSYVSGLGFGMSSGVYAFSNVLASMLGPGTFGIKGGDETYFIKSATLTSSIILLHILWSVIMFSSLDSVNYRGIISVYLSHFVVSATTLLDQENFFEISFLLIVFNILFSAYTAYVLVGGNLSRVQRSIGLGPNADRNR